jgi:hypothetical protein
MKNIWTIIKRFFRWPYNVYTLILILGVIEFIAGRHLYGVFTIVLGAWAFIIELTRPKV